MSSFTDALVLIDLEDGETFEVGGDFTYHIGDYPSYKRRTVKKGFRTNLASKPSLLRRTGKYNKAAVLHDALYDNPYVMVNLAPVWLSRKECDQIFLEAMLVCNVNKFKAHSYYFFVRAWGWRYWKHD